MKKHTSLFFLASILFIHSVQSQKNPPPFLQKQGTSTQLIVKGKPFIVLGGELGNSTASDVSSMASVWKKAEQMNCNTILTPVYWALMEPQKGQFDFKLIDHHIDSARKHDLKLIVLWFGSWKNSMSCYVPSWVKTDYKTYPRAYSKSGEPQEILTSFSNHNWLADMAAFSALMKHLKEKDEQDQTVIMVQVENEIGMLPSARDFHPDATNAFNQDVPQSLIKYLELHKNYLAPALSEAWKKEGYKTKGNWEQVFGKDPATDEIFIAWSFGEFSNKVAEAGKKTYHLPMFANAALNRPGAMPGEYPSGGPLPHLMDIWKAAAPAIDFLSPDFYNPNFKHWNDQYRRADNPLFIPEIRFDASVHAKALYAIGHYEAIGFSPFSIETASDSDKDLLSKTYHLIGQLAPLISANQGKSRINGSLLKKSLNTDTIKLGEYVFIVKHDYTLGWSPHTKDDEWPETGGIIIQTAADEFIVAGTGIVISFLSIHASKGKAGILNIEEGEFRNNVWTPGRILNGDQTHQGRHLRLESGDFGIQKLKLYTYQ